MTWNWQLHNWPQFVYDAQLLAERGRLFVHNAGEMLGGLRHVTVDDVQQLRVELISAEALKTSEIEGALLSRDSLQSSIRKQFGLAHDSRKVSPAEQGIARMMVDLYQNYQQPLTHQQLFTWHEMLMSGRCDVQDVGAYRTHVEPMRIISGPDYAAKVHFEAPPSHHVAEQMAQFVAWFNRTEETLPALQRAGICHLYFESIHPFEDGNGRIGRALCEKVLSQSLERPTLIALAQSIAAGRKQYYAALQAASCTLAIDDWLDYFSATVLQAQGLTQAMIDFLIAKAHFYQRYAASLNARQAKVLARMFREGVAGFKGGLSAENYLSITGTTRATATRDLQNLVELGALRRSGERRYTRYALNI